MDHCLEDQVRLIAVVISANSLTIRLRTECSNVRHHLRLWERFRGSRKFGSDEGTKNNVVTSRRRKWVVSLSETGELDRVDGRFEDWVLKRSPVSP